VSVNVESEGKVEFRLVYEELLERHLEHYQHIVHINLPQVRLQTKRFHLLFTINRELSLKGKVRYSLPPY